MIKLYIRANVICLILSCPLGAEIVTSGVISTEISLKPLQSVVVSRNNLYAPYSLSGTTTLGDSLTAVGPEGDLAGGAVDIRATAQSIRVDSSVISPGTIKSMGVATIQIRPDEPTSFQARVSTAGLSPLNYWVWSLEQQNAPGYWFEIGRQVDNGLGHLQAQLAAGVDYRVTMRSGFNFSGLASLDHDRTNWLWGLGSLPGTTAENPVLPVVESPEGFVFDIAPDPNEIVFIDPVIATGYTYTTDNALFRSVLIPDELPGSDSEFELVAGESVYLLSAGTEFDLTTINPLGLATFAIQGIDVNEMLDPNDPTLFVTGLGFTHGGASTVTMSPITVAIPEPSILAIPGLLLVGGPLVRRERKLVRPK